MTGILSVLFEEFVFLIFCLNLQVNFSTYASVLPNLIQQEFFSFMPKAFTVTSFLTSGSYSFGGWNSALIFQDSDSSFQSKAGTLNQQVTPLTFVASM